MSEYQYYKWQTIDRLLTETEQEGVNGLSSHIDVTASQAVGGVGMKSIVTKLRRMFGG